MNIQHCKISISEHTKVSTNSEVIMKLTIYSDTFDTDSTEKSFNSKILLENKVTGTAFSTVREACDFAITNNITIDSIQYCYSKDNVKYGYNLK
jgi:hypothetical protein